MQQQKHQQTWARLLLVVATTCFTLDGARADEQTFGYVRGAETLPRGETELLQFFTLRTGKHEGRYDAWDSDTEAEHGFTDTFQASLSVKQHYFDFKNVDELGTDSFYRFAGFELGAKYRLTSVFKDGYGLAFHPEIGFLRYDDVGGIIEGEIFVAPELLFQKNYLDDTLILAANAGFELAWGKQPAEEYDRELSLTGGLGASYRFAANWFFGLETHIRSEYPKFDLAHHEHTVLLAGPTLHYGAERWWATLSWANQVWGKEVDAVESGRAFAEEASNEFRLKLGLNF